MKFVNSERLGPAGDLSDADRSPIRRLGPGRDTSLENVQAPLERLGRALCIRALEVSLTDRQGKHHLLQRHNLF